MAVVCALLLADDPRDSADTVGPTIDNETILTEGPPDGSPGRDRAPIAGLIAPGGWDLPGMTLCLAADRLMASGRFQLDGAAPGGIPPEVLEQLSRRQPPGTAGRIAMYEPLGTLQRVGLVLLGLLALLIGWFLCRSLYQHRYGLRSPEEAFLAFGVFGAVLALTVAGACMGSLYLHLAGSICTMISGYCLTAFLLPQFSLTRRWLVGAGSPAEPKKEGQGVHG
ncbi:MAG: hypothetical protein JW810_12835 [Sedimentisphaerales bacterium]|nr:hypothetical protein [Sedimentisphaerales bacterium]